MWSTQLAGPWAAGAEYVSASCRSPGQVEALPEALKLLAPLESGWLAPFRVIHVAEVMEPEQSVVRV